MRGFVAMVAMYIFSPSSRVVKVIIQRSDPGPSGDRLPVAHTCFNILDLPPYPMEQMMKQVWTARHPCSHLSGQLDIHVVVYLSKHPHSCLPV